MCISIHEWAYRCLLVAKSYDLNENDDDDHDEDEGGGWLVASRPLKRRGKNLFSHRDHRRWSIFIHSH